MLIGETGYATAFTAVGFAVFSKHRLICKKTRLMLHNFAGFAT
jgi:hypothetical protein